MINVLCPHVKNLHIALQFWCRYEIIQNDFFDLKFLIRPCCPRQYSNRIVCVPFITHSFQVVEYPAVNLVKKSKCCIKFPIELFHLDLEALEIDAEEESFSPRLEDSATTLCPYQEYDTISFERWEYLRHPFLLEDEELDCARDFMNATSLFVLTVPLSPYIGSVLSIESSVT